MATTATTDEPSADVARLSCRDIADRYRLQIEGCASSSSDDPVCKAVQTYWTVFDKCPNTPLCLMCLSGSASCYRLYSNETMNSDLESWMTMVNKQVCELSRFHAEETMHCVDRRKCNKCAGCFAYDPMAARSLLEATGHLEGSGLESSSGSRVYKSRLLGTVLTLVVIIVGR